MYFKKVILVCVIAWLTYLMLSFFDEQNYEDSIQGKNVVVTGASSGIGEQMAYWYARYGANVFITARRGELLEKVVAQCTLLGKPSAKFGYVMADMSRETDREIVIQEAVDLFGDVDHLILNHAKLPRVNAWEGSKRDVDELRSTLETNVVSFAHLTGLALPSLQKTRGSVAVVGSLVGRFPFPYGLEYAASKFALDGFFSGLRLEFLVTQRNVSVTFATIGTIGTDAATAAFNRYLDKMRPHPEFLKQLCMSWTPEDCARAIVSATTRRQGEVYYPRSQALWPLGVARSIFPQLLEYIDLLGFHTE